MKLASLTLMLFLVASGFSGASGGQKPDPFANVPSSQRDRLKSRLTEFIEYHRTKKWDKVYDMFAERSKQAVEGGLPKELFLKKKLYSDVRKFTPKSVQRMDDDWWMVWGCANFDRGGNLESNVEAYLQNGDWFFSDVWSSPPCIDCMPHSCKQ